MSNTALSSAPTKPSPKRPSPKQLCVIRKCFVSPHMIRVTLGGEGLKSFSKESEGGYIKLFLTKANANDSSAIVRTYTVRKYYESECQIDVDFVVHDTDGPAVSWAQTCQVGDQILVGGPGPRKFPKDDADWVLMVGDMSALPAISANLEAMDRQTKGYVLVEILHENDKQEIDLPANIKIEWLVNAHPEIANTILFDGVKKLEWLDGEVYIWIAGELTQSLAIRSFMKKEKGITRQQMYASSYWQIGQTEDGHKIAKRNAEEGN